MKHYLDLIKISAKQHRRQNRMTRFCIVLSVFLVTVIFGMADMEMRLQLMQAKETDGYWHAAFSVDEEQGEFLKARPEVEAVARYGTLNYHLKDGYRINETETGICGFDQEFQEMIPDARVVEGTFPEMDNEAVINENIKVRLGMEIGDTFEMSTPQGEIKKYRVTGIAKNTALTAELDAFCIFLNAEGFAALYGEECKDAGEVFYYVKFRPFCNIQQAIDEISSQFGLGLEQVRQNAKVLMLMFQSRDSYLMQFYFVAAVLSVLVVIAGILMITASMNSSIARRTEFFGMMRCLGATGKQVIRFVRREALSWCKTAIPYGVFAGIFVVWLLCGMLRHLSPGFFDGLPVFGISWMGIAAGVLVGLVTVLLAAGSPAKRASGVSPLTAVSGNAGTVQAVKRTANTWLFKVDTALGVHHATGSKKNFFLITGSFAFSIILFLAFSTAIDFMHHAVTPLRPSAPDIYIYKGDHTNQIPLSLAGKIREYPGVKCVFGRSYGEFVLSGSERPITVITYDEQQFRWAEDSLMEGNVQDAVEGKGALSVFRNGNILAVGSSVRIMAGGKEREVPIAGILGDVPYSYGVDSNTGSITDMIICSEELFREMTGEEGYNVLDVQLYQGASDAQVLEIRKTMEDACESGVIFSDRRMKNRNVKGATYSMSVFLYGFLAVIALIGFFNIMNSIAMSVSSRMKEYGAMRAVGMSVRQLLRMVLGEAMTYTVFGLALGCAIGLPLNKTLFQSLVSSKWGDAWSIPGWELLVIVLVMLASVCLAVTGPAKQIGRMTVVDTINRE